MAPKYPQDHKGDLESGDSGSDEAEWRGVEDEQLVEESEEDEPEKDDEEERLEKLVFGDSAAFSWEPREASGKQRAFPVGGHTAEGVLQEEEDGDDLEGLADDQLFFLDSGPTTANDTKAVARHPGAHEEDEDEFGHGAMPAWIDSDDERLSVSLANVPRLRKLRVAEDEDLVSGREYIRRLRRQFQRLNGTPEWARWDWDKVGRRKRGHESDDGSDGDDDGMMDLDEQDDELRADPLRQMLERFKEALYAPDRPQGGRKRRKLRQDNLDIQRMKDVPGAQPSAIASLSLHPTLPILLSSGPASTIYLHHLDSSDPNNPNPLLTSLHVKRSPLTTTAFHPDPSRPRIFLSAPRRYFHVWDLAAGTVDKVTRVYGHRSEQRNMARFKLSPDGAHMALVGSSKRGSGVLTVLNAATLQWVAEARIESRDGIADFAWWRSGAGLCIMGKNGEATEYDVGAQRAVARWVDEGAVGTTALCLGGKSAFELGGDRWAVTGSAAGIVNVYDRGAWAADADPKWAANAHIPRNPRPKRTLDQLVTPVSHLAVSLDGQLLLMASRWRRDALRLVHLPSCAVYGNWPTGNTPLGRVSAVAWARPDAAGEGAADQGVVSVLVVGNEAGRIRMWEVRG